MDWPIRHDFLQKQMVNLNNFRTTEESQANIYEKSLQNKIIHKESFVMSVVIFKYNL